MTTGENRGLPSLALGRSHPGLYFEDVVQATTKVSVEEQALIEQPPGTGLLEVRALACDSRLDNDDRLRLLSSQADHRYTAAGTVLS